LEEKMVHRLEESKVAEARTELALVDILRKGGKEYEGS